MKKLTWALLSLMLFLGLGTASAQPDMPSIGGGGGGEIVVMTPTLTPASGYVAPGATIDATFPVEMIQSLMTSQVGMAFILDVENDADTKLETTPEILGYIMSQLMGGDEEEMAIAEGDDDNEAPSYNYKIAVYGMDPLSDPEDPDDLAAYMKWYTPITILEDADGDVKLRAKVAVMQETTEGNEVVYSDEFTADYTTKPSLPTFEPAAGEVALGTMVELACETGGATIYFTTDGTEPTAESEEYSMWDSEILITKAMTVKAIAVL
ncbi:MAG: chitobiase/beta-hexosaminidase C-terminal domain-containing protein, partial [Bacteroidales bacterium]|nr:chitobiase/beta-hexosaminidase C-terminal domain-containing protein [Bacteroidales bacterium]